MPRKRLPVVGKPVTPPRPTSGVVPLAPRRPTRIAFECPALSPSQWAKHLQRYQTSMDWDCATLGPEPYEEGCSLPKIS